MDLQQRLLKIRDNKKFQISVTVVILISSLMVGANTYRFEGNAFSQILAALDLLVTIFFVIEISVRFFAEDQKKAFFKDGWNIFDFLIVTISLVPISNVESVFVARLLRIIRVLRIITVIPAFRHIIDSLVKTIPRVGFIALLMFIFMYVWGAIGTMFFGVIDPDHWGNIGLALITLVQIATYDDWAAIMGEVIEVYPFAWIFFVSFIVINAVILLNMVIGVIVDVMTGDILDRDKQDSSEQP